MLFVTIILLIIFIAHIFIAKFYSVPDKSWWYVFIYIIALDVGPMSHLWHLLYGEHRINCPERRNEVFGWTPCFVFDWNTLVNTYEITLVLEFLILSALTFYILFDLFSLNIIRNVLVFLLNAAHIILTLILLFSPPLFLDSFTYTFDLTGFILTFLIVVLVEVYVRIPYFGYLKF